jgi:hypothetical protein
MAHRLAHMLSTSGMQAASFTPRPATLELIIKGETNTHHIDGDRGDSDGKYAQTGRRTRIWEFGSNLHCSIIGTCMSTAELRHVLDKLKIAGAAVASDHELHGVGVTLAGRRENGAKFLQKALDKRHRSAIARFSRAKEANELSVLWEQSLSEGDIPGAYWAVLTHPATTENIVKRMRRVI